MADPKEKPEEKREESKTSSLPTGVEELSELDVEKVAGGIVDPCSGASKCPMSSSQDKI